MSPWKEMAAQRVTMQQQIETLEARLNTEHFERVLADFHARHATEEAVELLRGVDEPLARLRAHEEALAVLQARVAALEQERNSRRGATVGSNA